MKIDRTKALKSSFLSIEKDMGLIMQEMLKNERLKKLLFYTSADALEPDKAKPQVGQLSDLGLVELTRHRQGQALAEVFAKKCPHCQGNGFIMEDIKYASPTAEGEYRAKAAKMKLPLSGFKKNNNQKFNNKNQKFNNEQQRNAQGMFTNYHLNVEKIVSYSTLYNGASYSIA